MDVRQGWSRLRPLVPPQLNEIGFSDDASTHARSAPLPDYVDDVSQENKSFVVAAAVRSLCVKTTSGTIRLFNGGECLTIGKQRDIVHVGYCRRADRGSRRCASSRRRACRRCVASTRVTLCEL